ncbi:hypothetical protein ES708_28909 [subsurface metagenome]
MARGKRIRDIMSFSPAPGPAAQLNDPEPELQPSTVPLALAGLSAGRVAPTCWARSSSSQASQTLRKSMNRGGLPPDSQVMNSMVRSPWTSASVA